MKEKLKKIIIIGSGGGALEIIDLIHSINKVEPTWNIVGFVGEKEKRHEKNFSSYDVIDSKELNKFKDFYFVCSITSPKLKDKVIRKEVRSSNLVPATLIHPNSIISSTAIIKEGSVILSNVKIASNAKIGKHVWIDHNSLIGHDVQIESFSSIFPSSTVLGDVGKRCFVGAGSIIHQNASVGTDSFIGIGTNIINKIKPNSYIVNYQRIIKKSNKNE